MKKSLGFIKFLIFVCILSNTVICQVPTMVKDINVGASSSISGSRLGYFSNFQSQLYFSVNGINQGLWKSDGSDLGTVLVSSNNAGSSDPSYQFTTFNNELFFTRIHTPSGNSELWKTNGTTAGTVKVKTITTGSQDFRIRSLLVSNGFLFFTSFDTTNGTELWKSDGTEAGTMIVKDINPGTASGLLLDLFNFNNKVYFMARDGINGYELWSSDGSVSGTQMVKDINPGAGNSNPSQFIVLNNELYFFAFDGISQGIWKTDGTALGTVVIKNNIIKGSPQLSQFMAILNGNIYFTANISQSGNNEFWKSDGTEAGTVLVKDINLGTASSVIQYLIESNGTLFFAADNGVNGKELWKSDGTPAGTVMVKDINSGTGSGINNTQAIFYAEDGIVYFSATNGTNGYELWRSDGTEAGTVMISDINPGVGNSTPDGFEKTGNTLYFSADNGVNGRELWKLEIIPKASIIVESNSCQYPLMRAFPDTPGFTYQWKKEGFDIIGATNQTLKASSNGNYSVAVSNSSLSYNSTSIQSNIVYSVCLESVIISTVPINSNFAGQGENKQPFYIFNLGAKGLDKNINKITVRTAGGYSLTDFTKFKLFKNSIPNLIGASEIASLTPTNGVPETLNFIINETLLDNTNSYFIVTADISPTATLAINPQNLQDYTHIKTTIITNPLGLFFTTPIPNIYDNQPYAQSISFDQKYELTEGIYVKNSEFSIIGTATNSITSKAYISLVQNGIIIKTVELINGSYDLGSVYDGIYDVILHKTASGSLVPQLPDGFSAFTGERFGSGPFDAVADGKFTIQVLGDYIGGAKRKAVESIIFELVAAPLPINLLSFAAKQVAKLVNIGWHTSSETNFSHFELQTSNNGKEFSTSGEVKGNQSSIYNFTDSNPTEGVKYYKLKMVDLNGTYSLSKTISVNFEKNGSYLSVENPAQNGVILARSNYLNPSFTLLNSLGQKMLISISELPNNQHKISAKSINSGIYFLMVECEGKCETTKIVFE